MSPSVLPLNRAGRHIGFRLAIFRTVSTSGSVLSPHWQNLTCRAYNLIWACSRSGVGASSGGGRACPAQRNGANTGMIFVALMQNLLSVLPLEAMYLERGLSRFKDVHPE